MKKVLVVGAGMSSTAMLRYLCALAEKHSWVLIVADKDLDRANRWNAYSSAVQAAWLDVTKPNDRSDLVRKVDLVISMVPAQLFYKVGRQCIWHRKPIITSPYILHNYQSHAYGIDPETMNFIQSATLSIGYDQLMAKSMVDQVMTSAEYIESFTSYSGTLVDAQYLEHNPWKHKILWNSDGFIRNNKGFTPYILKGRSHYLSADDKFSKTYTVEIEDSGIYEAYRERGVYFYRDQCGLTDVSNIQNFTLRHPGFCEAWSAIHRLGFCTTDTPIPNSAELTYHELMDGIVGGTENTLRARVAGFLNLDIESEILDKLEWLGLFSRKKILLEKASPAKILRKLLEDKWGLETNDQDAAILMQKISYYRGTAKKEKKTILKVLPQDGDTALSRFVGLPLAMLAELILVEKVPTSSNDLLTNAHIVEFILQKSNAMGIAPQMLEAAMH